jgi:hypothetical protein
MEIAHGGPVTSIWGSGPDDVWALSDGVYHFDGHAWSEALSPGQGGALAQQGPLAFDRVRGDGAGGVWVLAGGTVLHFDGASWTAASPPSPLASTDRGLWGREDEVWIGAKTSDPSTERLVTSVFHFDGRAWDSSVVVTPAPECYGGSSLGSTWINDMSGSGSNDLWICGNTCAASNMTGVRSNFVQHWNGIAWSPVGAEDLQTVLDAPLAIDASGGDADVWAATCSQLWHWDGTHWTIAEYALTGAFELYALSRISSSDVLAVGYTATSADVGPKGTMFHFDGRSWKTDVFDDAGGFIDVWRTDANDIWVAGRPYMPPAPYDPNH